MNLVMVHIALVLTRWMSDVEIHHFCLGDMVELVMVLNVIFKFCCGHIWRCSHPNDSSDTFDYK